MDSTSGTQSSLASSKRVNLTPQEGGVRPLTDRLEGRQVVGAESIPGRAQVDMPISDTGDRPRVVFQNREILERHGRVFR
jgi:hypothetical protein